MTKKKTEDKIFDGTEIVDKDSKKATLSAVYENYKIQSPEKYEQKKEELNAKLKSTK